MNFYVCVVSKGQTTIEMFDSRSQNQSAGTINDCSNCFGYCSCLSSSSSSSSGATSHSGKRQAQLCQVHTYDFVYHLKSIFGTSSFWMIFLPRLHANLKIDELDPEIYIQRMNRSFDVESTPSPLSSPTGMYIGHSNNKDLDV